MLQPFKVVGHSMKERDKMIQITDLGIEGNEGYIVNDPSEARDTTDRIAAELALEMGCVVALGKVIAEPLAPRE